MITLGRFPEPSAERAAIEWLHRADETAVVEALLKEADLAPEARSRIEARVESLHDRFGGLSPRTTNRLGVTNRGSV